MEKKLRKHARLVRSQHHDSLTQAETLPWSDKGTFAHAAAFANQYDGRAAFQREDLLLCNRRERTHQQPDLFDVPLMHASRPPSHRRENGRESCGERGGTELIHMVVADKSKK